MVHAAHGDNKIFTRLNKQFGEDAFNGVARIMMGNMANGMS